MHKRSQKNMGLHFSREFEENTSICYSSWFSFLGNLPDDVNEVKVVRDLQRTLGDSHLGDSI
jgi:hypothetical protein